MLSDEILCNLIMLTTTSGISPKFKADYLLQKCNRMTKSCHSVTNKYQYLLIKNTSLSASFKLLKYDGEILTVPISCVANF